MKIKIIAIAAVAVVVSTSAFAKTEGNYLGIDVIRTEMEPDKKQAESSNFNIDQKKAHKMSAGLDYKYAFNMNNFFIAPGVFADYSNVKNKTIIVDIGGSAVGGSYISEFDLKYRAGAKVDVGFDLGRFAIFGSAGLAENFYNYKETVQGGFDIDLGPLGNYSNGKSSSSEKSGHALGLVYGGGAKFSLTDNLDLKASYEMSKFDARDNEGNKMKFKLNVIRAGLAFKF